MTATALLAFIVAAAPARAAAPDAKARRTLSAAIKLYHALDLQAALARFDAALAAFPGWKTAAGYRAACRWTLGDQAGAREDAALASRLKPDDAPSYAARGKARLILKDEAGALADFRAASDADPDLIEGPLGEAGVFSERGELKEALKRLDKAAKLDRRSATTLLLRGSVKSRLRDFRGAAADFAGAARLGPAFSWTHLYRGKALRDTKDYDGAAMELTIFLKDNPEHGDALYLRGNLFYFLGKYSEAEADLTKVISLDPRKGLAYANRGQARQKLGNKEGALSDLRKALELDPTRRDKIQAAIDSLEGKAP